MLRIVDDNQEAALLQSQATAEHKGKNCVDFDNLLAGEVERLGDHLEPQLASASESLDALTNTRREVKGLLSRLQGYRQERKFRTGSQSQQHLAGGGKKTTVSRS